MNAATPATRAALGGVRSAPTILDAVEAFGEVARAAGAEVDEDSEGVAAALAEGIRDGADPLVALAAVHAAGAVGGRTAEDLLLPLLTGERSHLREHAAWALASGPRVDAALGPLRAMVGEGGFAGTLAEATLESWDSRPVPRAQERAASRRGLSVAQLYLHGEIDSSLRHAGRGDTGGIATLLVRLGDALLEEPGIDRVLTLSRASEREDSDQASPEKTGACEAADGPGHHYLGIPVPLPAPPASRSWTLRAAALAGIRTQLAAATPVDVLHVRMADVGSWAAAQVAREHGIPLVLTLAPDPHALLAAREASGELTRATFVAADLREHLVFRIRLLRALREQAEALVVFPRPDLERDLSALLHIGPQEPVHVIPEGVDVRALDEADRQVALAMAGGTPAPDVAAALAELDTLLGTLPPGRRGLPVVLSVGRLHPVKGMATLARAWDEHPDLADRCTLLVVGGDLDRPTTDEADQLALLDEVVPRAEGPARGLLLAGHRTNPTVAVWLAAARRGRPGLAAPGGVYVCASLKEEFGIALCEALGSGLVVVAPDHGGPPTYVEHGTTGVLVDTGDPVLLGAAVAEALDLAAAPGAAERSEHARAVVVERFSITTMADALARVYQEVAR
ncbi:glycosyltransferase family 4 protein [Ornithinimicrobium cerasi]|uniref:glycosyltransferase family 4 protein n=1 Tax=Ornithinimicrobium cerasi TaxID=2248773 RepID=UPI000F00820D|nr:glycosyltransferase [Ornithinimicrobium cerasi]